MKLQLALDALSLDKALEMADQVRDYADILEIGTPFIVSAGLEPVRVFRQRFPDKEILADVKIIDGASLEATAAFAAGADYVTVLALADGATIRECVRVADAAGKRVAADLICVEDIPAKIRWLESLGVGAVAVHTGVDQQKRGRTPLEDLRVAKECARSAEVFVAGGINADTAAAYAKLNPAVLIVGNAITASEDPRLQAARIHERLRAGA